MELYEYARPELMSGKKILYAHGFASSGQTGTVKTLRLLLPECEIVAPDLPVEPLEAKEFLDDIAKAEKPDLAIGTSMGGMYVEMLYGIDRIIVNPAFRLAETILKNNGLGRHDFHNPRADGQTSILVTKGMIEAFREVSSRCFERAGEDRDKVYGLFGTRDDLVHTFDLFLKNYPQAIRFDGEHYLNDNAILHALLPVIQWIDDKQRGISRKVIVISLSDRIINHSSGFAKAVEKLSHSYDIQIQAAVPYNNPERCAEVYRWCEASLGVPVWNRVTITSREDFLLGDYLIDAEPDSGGAGDFMGTLVHFGSDTFKAWEDVLDYFALLGGQ